MPEKRTSAAKKSRGGKKTVSAKSKTAVGSSRPRSSKGQAAVKKAATKSPSKRKTRREARRLAKVAAKSGSKKPAVKKTTTKRTAKPAAKKSVKTAKKTTKPTAKKAAVKKTAKTAVRKAAKKAAKPAAKKTTAKKKAKPAAKKAAAKKATTKKAAKPVVKKSVKAAKKTKPAAKKPAAKKAVAKKKAKPAAKKATTKKAAKPAAKKATTKKAAKPAAKKTAKPAARKPAVKKTAKAKSSALLKALAAHGVEKKAPAVRPPFPAYKGTMPYIFVSYSHTDMHEVFPIIKKLNSSRYRIWFDEGIEPGNEWPEVVGRAVLECSQFMVFMSPTAVDSRNVRNEINLATSADKNILVIYLQDTNLSEGLLLQIGTVQYFNRFEMTEKDFIEKLKRVLSNELHN